MGLKRYTKIWIDKHGRKFDLLITMNWHMSKVCLNV